MKQVSIVVPVYRVERAFLEKCIESLINQDDEDIEIILVDDGSPDDCGKICDEYAKKDTRIISLHKENGGVSSARNYGLINASGNWVWFVDADDWVTKDSFEKLMCSIHKYPETDIIHFRAYQNYSNDEKKLATALKPDYMYSKDNGENLLFLCRNTMQPSNYRKKPIAVATSYFVWDKAYRRDFLITNNLRFPVGIKVSEDKLFLLDCLQHVNSYVMVNEFLYHYRANELSATHKYSEDLDRNRLELIYRLQDISSEMDARFSDLIKGNESLAADFRDFTVVAASSVIVNKFYHKDCPLGVVRRWKNAKEFAATPIIKNALSSTRLNTLSGKNKIRVILMKFKMYKLLTISSRINRVGGVER